MKIILLILSLFIVGCEKKLEVNHVMDGYISEEIVNVEMEYNDELFITQSIDLIDKNHVQFFVDMVDENDKNTNTCYHINVDEKTFKKEPYIEIQDEYCDSLTIWLKITYNSSEEYKYERNMYSVIKEEKC